MPKRISCFMYATKIIIGSETHPMVMVEANISTRMDLKNHLNNLRKQIILA